MKQYKNVTFENFSQPQYSIVWSDEEPKNWNTNGIKNTIELKSYDSEFSFVPKHKVKEIFDCLVTNFEKIIKEESSENNDSQTSCLNAWEMEDGYLIVISENNMVFDLQYKFTEILTSFGFETQGIIDCFDNAEWFKQNRDEDDDEFCTGLCEDNEFLMNKLKEFYLHQ